MIPQKPFTIKVQPRTIEAVDSDFQSKGEKSKWTRPEHTIARNEEAIEKAKELTKA